MAFFDFLALPGEIRNQIYRLALTTDPSELDQQHKYDCRWRNWDPAKPQRAMFDEHYQRLPGCKCLARSELALLLANRQINEEAALIFWTENHFTFRGFESFILLVGILRPRNRETIRHISVLEDARLSWFVINETFWHALFQCKGLRTLELPSCLQLFDHPPTPEHPDPETGALNHFRSMLPDLKTFSWITHRDHNAPKTPLGFSFKLAKCLDTEGLSPEQLKIAAPFNTNTDQLDGLFSCSLLPQDFPLGPGPYISSALKRRKAVPVSTGSPHKYRCVVPQKPRMVTWTAQRYLQPLSPDAIARNNTLKAREEKLKKTGETGYLGGLLTKLLPCVLLLLLLLLLLPQPRLEQDLPGLGQ